MPQTPGYKPCEKSGKVVCGDMASGLAVLASIVNTLLTTCAPIKTAKTCCLVSVVNSIRPSPTPWILSSRPSHS